MLLNAVLSASIVVLASTGPLSDNPDSVRLSKAEKAAIVQRIVNHAADCVVREIRAAKSTADLSDQIVAVMPVCAGTMRTMIESFDANYGEGSGETFFSGSFLDWLPNAVAKRLQQYPK